MVDPLSLVDASLPERFAAVSDDVRRDVARAVAVAALERTHLADERITQALEALRRGHVGDRPEREALVAFVDELDAAAFDAQDRLDAGAASDAEYADAFRKARAATALLSAFDSDPATAAADAVYEAYHAFDEDVTAIREVINARM